MLGADRKKEICAQDTQGIEGRLISGNKGPGAWSPQFCILWFAIRRAACGSELKPSVLPVGVQRVDALDHGLTNKILGVDNILGAL